MTMVGHIACIAKKVMLEEFLSENQKERDQ
jgi:hypothetical protein